MDQYYYEYKDDGDVKYCYPGTQVLVNKFDIAMKVLHMC